MHVCSPLLPLALARGAEPVLHVRAEARQDGAAGAACCVRTGVELFERVTHLARLPHGVPLATDAHARSRRTRAAGPNRATAAGAASKSPLRAVPSQAAGLRLQLRVRPGDRVAVAAARGDALLELLLAAAAAGAVAVPLNTRWRVRAHVLAG